MPKAEGSRLTTEILAHLARACQAIQLNTIMMTVLLPPGLRESDDVMDRLDALVDLHDDIAID